MAQLFATAAGLPLEHVRVQSVLAREYPPTGVVAEMWAVYPVHVDVTDTPKSLQDKLLTSTATVLGGTTINPYGANLGHVTVFLWGKGNTDTHSFP